MLQKVKILDEKLDKLNEINNEKFIFEKFNQINFQIEKILLEIKSNDFGSEKNSLSQYEKNFFINLLNKLDRLETKISYKANLFESFSKSNT